MSDTIWGSIIGMVGAFLVLLLGHIGAAKRNHHQTRSLACRKILENIIEADRALKVIGEIHSGLLVDDPDRFKVLATRKLHREVFYKHIYDSKWMAYAHGMKDLYALFVILEKSAVNYLVKSHSILRDQKRYADYLDLDQKNPLATQKHVKEFTQRYEANELAVNDLAEEYDAISRFTKKWVAEKQKVSTRYANSWLLQRFLLARNDAIRDCCAAHLCSMKRSDSAYAVWCKHGKSLEAHLDYIGVCPEIQHTPGHAYMKDITNS